MDLAGAPAPAGCGDSRHSHRSRRPAWLDYLARQARSECRRCGDSGNGRRGTTNRSGDISRVALFGKLDSLAFKAMESAAAFCKLRGNPYVELRALDPSDPADACVRPASHRAGVRSRCDGTGAGSHGGTGSAAAWRERHHRSVCASRRCDRAGLGLDFAEIRRVAGSHRRICSSRC